MKRKKVSSKIVKDILVKSKRRCCLCFGLNNDLTEKAGQIAHIDGNASNSVEDNLVYLCLEHHDRFDSSTSQSKGISKNEVTHYREELYRTIRILSNQSCDTSMYKFPNENNKITANISKYFLKEDYPHSKLSYENDKGVFVSLLDSIQAWYNEIIDGLEHLKIQNEKVSKTADDNKRKELIFSLGFAYVWRRKYLPVVITITDIIENRHGKIPIVVEVDTFLKLLTERDKKKRAGIENCHGDKRSDALIT